MEVLYVVLLFTPFVMILWLANRAESEMATSISVESTPTRKWLSNAAMAYLLLILLYSGLIVFGVSAWVVGWLIAGPLGAQLAPELPVGLDPRALSAVGLGMWLPSLFGVVLLLPAVRRLAGRLLPDFRPTSPVHAVALSFIALICVNLLTTLGAGLGNLADMLEQAPPTNMVSALWAQECAMALMALVGVGWWTRRSLRDGLRRLAIVRPTAGQVLVGFAAGAGLAAAVVALEVWLPQIGIMNNADVERLSEQLLGPLVHQPLGILTLGLAAALGEESLFRGALQPRFGLIFTAALFALLHSTYGLSLATAIVFGIGLTLGVVRRRANTTTSMIVHATYNIAVSLIAASGLLK